MRKTVFFAAVFALLQAGADELAEAIVRDWMRQDADRIDVSACFTNATDCALERTMARRVTDEEKETVCLWLDLGVPYCGSYLEGRLWTPEEEKAYAHYQEKRVLYAEDELRALRRGTESR